jgi:putative restriction endonuclease
MSLDGATITRLEKAAVDNGFDQIFAVVDGWLPFASTQAPLRMWLTLTLERAFVVALSQQNVIRALSDVGVPYGGFLPPAARGARAVADIPSLHHVVRRAFHLSRTLPDELLHTFISQTAALPRTTEAERLVVQRVGQDIFRRGLMEYWEGCCAITGLSATELLRASHIKPWAACDSDRERLDIFNGLLLAPHFDASFDAGLITVADDGTVLISRFLTEEDRRIVGLVGSLRVRKLTDEHRSYLRWHRENLSRERTARR